MHKRYMFFGHIIDEYAQGGIDDCIHSFDTLEEVKKNFSLNDNKYYRILYNNECYNNIHLFDRQEGILVDIIKIIQA